MSQITNERSRYPSAWKKATGVVGNRFRPFNSNALCGEARARTGLRDAGPPAIDPALSTLANSLEAEANLHLTGRFMLRAHLRQLLENRLRLAAAWQANAKALDDVPIQRPLFVVGMPRTGSTFLHELLGEDPANRAPRVWEVMFPVPSRRGKREQLWRVRKTELCLWWFRRMAPEADAVYPVRARTPHECVAIQSHTFLSEEFVTTCRVPSYQKFLRAADLTPAYTWEKKFLQHLQIGNPPKRWVLKSPDHVFGLEELFSVFPDAVIIQTHRNPLEVLRSTTKLTRVLHDLYAWPEDREVAVFREAQGLGDATERFIEFRDRHPELSNRFIDVKYSEIASEPLAAVERIYRHIDCPLTGEAANRMRQLAANRSRYGGRGAHASLDELKAGIATQASRFKSYCSRFGLSYEIGM